MANVREHHAVDQTGEASKQVRKRFAVARLRLPDQPGELV
jgi:hypothetical protein